MIRVGVCKHGALDRSRPRIDIEAARLAIKTVLVRRQHPKPTLVQAQNRTLIPRPELRYRRGMRVHSLLAVLFISSCVSSGEHEALQQKHAKLQAELRDTEERLKKEQSARA